MDTLIALLLIALLAVAAVTTLSVILVRAGASRRAGRGEGPHNTIDLRTPR